MEQRPMLTLSQVMAKLVKDKGVHLEFRMDEDREMKLQNSDRVYQPQDLRIIKTYRFEGESNPSDNAVLYVAMDSDGNKGMIIDSYGPDSNYPQEFDDFIRKIPVEEQEEYDFDKNLE